MRFIIRRLFTLLALCLLNFRAAIAQQPAQLAQQKAAIDVCLRIVRGCQLTDGAIVVKKHHGKTGPVWVQQYFACHAALALLVANESSANQEDLLRVQKWLEWCAKHQEAEGFWFEFQGTNSGYTRTDRIDAWDSSAALYLIVAERYQRTGRPLSAKMISASVKSVKCIQAVTDPSDGLTWATPDYKVKFLMDNVEVYGGLLAATKLFRTLKKEPEALATARMAERIQAGLPKYRDEQNQLYATSLDANGQFETKNDQLYPHGLAQLFGLSFIEAKTGCWKKTVSQFSPDDGPLAAAGPERWLPAASHQTPAEASKWRDSVIKAALQFKSQEVYISRPSLVVLALLSGSDWMPNLTQ